MKCATTTNFKSRGHWVFLLEGKDGERFIRETVVRNIDACSFRSAIGDVIGDYVVLQAWEYVPHARAMADARELLANYVFEYLAELDEETFNDEDLLAAVTAERLGIPMAEIIDHRDYEARNAFDPREEMLGARQLGVGGR